MRKVASTGVKAKPPAEVISESLFRAMQPREPGYCPRCKAETPHVVLDWSSGERVKVECRACGNKHKPVQAR
jgi:hypothetical protein